MGEVYRARDLRLHRDVAVKVLPTHLKPGSMQLAQFEHEAHLLASLNHPNICSIYDVGSEGGTSFMVMEHLRGETLAARIARSPISVNVALVYAIQIIEALAVAHDAGLVHRDIKPGNIMLTTNGVKLLDFGLAKRHMIAAAMPSTATNAETASSSRDGIVGTLHYMAPEQLAGAAVDARSDIWAFGCVVYEMVTGRRTFSGKTLTDVISAIVSDRPIVMTMERGVVPLVLEHVVAKCLARNPSERWQSAGEVARELRSMLPHAKTDSASTQVDSGRVGQPPSNPPTDLAQSAGRSRTGLWMAIAATVLAVIGAAGWFLFGRGISSAPSNTVAVLPFPNASGASGFEYLTEGLADGIAAELARRPRVNVIASSTVSHQPSQADPRAVGRTLGADRIVTGRMTVRAGRIDVDAEIIDVAKGSALWSGHYSEAESNLAALARQLFGGILTALQLEPKSQDLAVATVPTSLSSDVYRLILRGRYGLRRLDEGSLKSAVAFFTDATAKDPRAAVAHAGLAEAYYALAQRTIAAMRPNDALPRAKRAATKAIELDPSLAEAHLSLGAVKATYDRDWPGAGAAYERAVALEPSNPSAHAARAEWLMIVGRSEDALTEARRAARLDPLSASASYTLGWQLYLARQYSDAIDQLKTTIALDPMVPAAHWALAAAYEKSGRLQDAIRELQDSSTTSPNRSAHLAELGYVYARASRAADARQVLQRLESTAGSSYDIALVAAGLNDRETAFVRLEQAADEHVPAMTTVAVDPRFDDLRSDPRFKELLKRIGL